MPLDEHSPLNDDKEPTGEIRTDAAAQSVYRFVREVPAGSVVTYGQIAGMLTDVTLTARQVGQIMNVSPPDVPWQRVVGAGGRLPIGKRSVPLALQQRHLLEAEGVAFLANDCVDMARFQWHGTQTMGGLFDE